jgi:hypothetical protein
MAERAACEITQTDAFRTAVAAISCSCNRLDEKMSTGRQRLRDQGQADIQTDKDLKQSVRVGGKKGSAQWIHAANESMGWSVI